MFHQLQSEFTPKFNKTDLVFIDEYNNAYKRVAHYPSEDQERAIRMILSEVLANYAKSKANTKGGRIGRFFAMVLGVVVRFIKIK